jgi:opacity protein-like surface antigen
MPWLALRGGYRQVAASFAAAGAALMDEPATGTAYTAGVGLNIADASFDLSYEYTHIGYEDAWQSNVNFNKIYRHSLWLETGFRF